MRIAFVIPWFGPELKGGSEQQAWQLATRLASRGHVVEALTTCCRSFLDDWAVDHLPAGNERIEGVEVRRFPVERRDRPAFDRLNGKLLSLPVSGLRPGVSPVSPDEARIWTGENINSLALEQHIASNAGLYDAFIFIPYLYGTTLRGLPKVADKAWMEPCFHDEAYAYLPDTATVTYAARGLLFNSLGEQELAARLFGPAVWAKGHVTGGGIEFAELDVPRSFELPEALAGRRFVLFLGRRDPGKGINLVIEAHARMGHGAPGEELALVLAGPGEQHYGDATNGVIDLGLVSEEVRVALLQNCTALALPSPNESFSRVLYEAWYAGKPAIVRRSCDATRIAVEACGGGWVAESVREWTQALSMLRKHAPGSSALRLPGERGRAYSHEHAQWDRVIDRYEAILAAGPPPADLARPEGAPQTIHQMSPVLAYGDAISNEMLAIRQLLRQAGYRSDILTTGCDPGLAGEAVAFAPGVLAPEDGLIYHHSIGSAITAPAVRHAGPKALVYHNITPAEFFRPHRPEFARLLRDGREEMWGLGRVFDVSVGDSEFNARELAQYGFASPGVLPLPIEPSAWNFAPTPAWMELLADGRPNVLFVGRMAPNKRQDRLVEAFAELRSMMDARLVLAGSYAAWDPFARQVLARAKALGLEDDVLVPGHGSFADLHALYRSADVFWSFSEHEGFCVPLIEAMWFDVPVVALAASAVPETLAGAGLTFPWAESDRSIAELVRRVLVDGDLRARMLRAQRARRAQFGRKQTAAALAHVVARISASHTAALEAAHA